MVIQFVRVEIQVLNLFKDELDDKKKPGFHQAFQLKNYLSN